MTNNNNQPGDLRMFVRSEPYEVECGKCNGKGWLDRGIVEKCPDCHGTGKRMVTLEGWVPVRPAIVGASCCCDSDSAGVKLVLPDSRFRGRQKLEDATEPEYLVYSLVDIHRAGTLPAELYKSDDNTDGLEEIDA